MDIIIRLIEFLIQALVEGNRRNQTPAPRAQPRAQPSNPGSPARNQPLAPRTPVAPQGPVYDDEGWRRLVAWLGIIVLIIMLAVWLLYMNGYLSGG